MESIADLPRLKNVNRSADEFVKLQLCNFLISDVGDQVANTRYASLKKTWTFWPTFGIKVDLVMIAVALVDQAPDG